ncbi:LysR family transcriptional regulator [uncultured Sphingomonas sp.]|uniref:LysR family transcriptional regulator n=1 Tax=uncultured Sphingomonas sp. TaxID=158754 RepID=UPI0025D2D3B8|nr:LysR family transcriptional regulator [uncultured Sphingomonas sp.]
MDQTAPPPPPAPRPERNHWTPARQRIFLAALLEFGCVSRAARAAGMSRSSAHRLRARLADTPFVRQWDAALAEHARRMADPFARPPGPGAPAPRR